MGRKSSKESVKRWRKNTKRRIVEAFGNKCGQCGQSFPDEVYDLHHINPEEKDFSLGGIRANSISWKRVVIELRKCVLLCANCHRMIEHNSVNLNKHASRFNEDFATYEITEIFDYKTNTYKKIHNEFKDVPCPICGGKVHKNSKKYCSQKCSQLDRRTVERPSIEKLKLLVEKNGYCATGRQFGVSDNTIRKWLKNIPG